MRATGHAEVWHDSDDSVKFQQYGWRCTKKEDAYSTRTLIGNWSEERRDLRSLAQRKPLPSQYSHYFGTTYSASYDTGGKAAERRGSVLLSFYLALNEAERVQDFACPLLHDVKRSRPRPRLQETRGFTSAGSLLSTEQRARFISVVF
ncbi:UNVERIFIED_CONTAM: hypothetical protein FKN15_006302 [Acipenser sinensis]